MIAKVYIGEDGDYILPDTKKAIPEVHTEEEGYSLVAALGEKYVIFSDET